MKERCVAGAVGGKKGRGNEVAGAVGGKGGLSCLTDLYLRLARVDIEYWPVVIEYGPVVGIQIKFEIGGLLGGLAGLI